MSGKTLSAAELSPPKVHRRERELDFLKRHADGLDAEGDDSAAYQADWTEDREAESGSTI